MKDKLKLGYIGTGNYGGVFLNFLLMQNYIDVNRVLTINNERYSFLQSSKNKNYMQFHNYSFYERKKDYNCFPVDLDCIITAGWPYKIPAEVINHFDFPFLNIHPSLLPKYRGPEPIIQQILNDEKIGGVTIHRMDADWDNGGICGQLEFEILPQDNNKTLFLKVGRMGIKILKKILTDLLKHNISFKIQNKQEATYYPKINILDYIIDKNKYIEDVIRYSKAFFWAYPLIAELNGKLIIFKDFTFSKNNLKNYTSIKLKDGYLIVKNFLYYEGNY